MAEAIRCHVQERQCRYKVTLRRVRATIFEVEGAINFAYFACVCSLILSSMQCAYTILSSVASPTVRNFSTISLKRRDFVKKKMNY